MPQLVKISVLLLIAILIGCVHKPPALTMPHVPPVTNERPGAVTR